MSGLRLRGLRDGLAGRVQVSGMLIASGLGFELATFFWNHPVSLFLFLSLGAGLVTGGMLLFLWSIVTRTG